MITKKDYLRLGVTPPKTAKEIREEVVEKVKRLPVETKKKFWRAMVEEGKNVGQAREMAGIDDVMVAAELVIQCHKAYYLPIDPDDIL